MERYVLNQRLDLGYDRDGVDRFYRSETAGVPGSGLGLAIVRKIAQRHRASVDLGPGAGGRGLKVTVRFPGE